MIKEWYIFVNSTHIGPYTLNEVKAFYEKRDIKDNTMIWKEGMAEWLPYKKVEIFSLDTSDLPPPLPADVFTKVTIPTILQEQNLEKNLEIFTDVIPEEFIPAQRKVKSPQPFKIIAAIFAIVFIFARIFIYKKSAPPDLHIRGISPYNREQLENQLVIDPKNMSFALALAMDKGNLWVGTNQKNDLSVTIDLIADPHRLLRDESANKEEVAVRLQGMITNHLGHFTTMKMIKGSKFFPGEYNVRIKGKKIHWINQYFKLNKHDLNQEFTFNFKSLIYSGNAREFERKLVDRHVEKINKLTKVWLDKLESLQTLKSLNDKNMELFLTNFEKSKTGQNFSDFEKNYIKEIGPIIQILVVTAHNDLTKDNGSELARFDEAIVDFGKRVGALASDMITQITPLKKIDVKVKKKWRENFQKKSDAIGIMIKIYIEEIETHIKEIQSRP
jgi:hypothetical protein